MEAFKSTNLFEFKERFKTTNDCYQYLIDLKWGKGFRCSRCNCKTAVRSKTWYYRRCKECQYDESATSGTLFHKLKFPLIKAFYILFRLSISKKGISSVQIGKEFGIQQKTAYLFKRKVHISMRESGDTMLTGKVNVDEFTVGGPEKGMQGRSHSSKNKVIIAIELRGRKKKRKIGLAYAQCIDDYSTESIRPFFKSVSDLKYLFSHMQNHIYYNCKDNTAEFYLQSFLFPDQLSAIFPASNMLYCDFLVFAPDSMNITFDNAITNEAPVHFIQETLSVKLWRKLFHGKSVSDFRFTDIESGVVYQNYLWNDLWIKGKSHDVKKMIQVLLDMKWPGVVTLPKLLKDNPGVLYTLDETGSVLSKENIPTLLSHFEILYNQSLAELGVSVSAESPF